MAERDIVARHTVVSTRRERQVVCFQEMTWSLRQKNNREKSVISASPLFFVSRWSKGDTYIFNKMFIVEMKISQYFCPARETLRPCKYYSSVFLIFYIAFYIHRDYDWLYTVFYHVLYLKCVLFYGCRILFLFILERGQPFWSNYRDRSTCNIKVFSQLHIRAHVR